MSRGPLRFLVLAVGLWIAGRAAILAPGWWAGREAPPPASTPTGAGHTEVEPATSVPAVPPETEASTAASRTASHHPRLIRQLPYKAEGIGLPFLLAVPGSWPTLPGAPVPASPRVLVAVDAAVAVPGASEGRATTPPDRWSVSGWALVRRERGGSALAPGGTLGGSQAGARIAYRLGNGFALSGRAYLPLRRAAGAEAAAGLDWRPVASLPVNILAERRQALGGEGRSAFALTLHGGFGLVLPRGLRLDGYGQAGVVGTKARDLFVDGAVRVSAPVGPLEVGVGARGAAQPGAARLDAGPGLAYRLPLRGANVRIEADWRFRVAGAAAPGSGPALTLVTDF